MTGHSHNDALNAGAQIRREVPRSSHSTLAPSNRDPLALLHQQNVTRVQELVPLRWERMAQSPFAFFRGSAAIMAHDLAATPTTNIPAVVCGDAHINNFGFYASPQRSLVFDLNDFDEATIGPWEWDIKRLLSSIVIGGREIGLDSQHLQETVFSAGESYRTALKELMKFGILDRYYHRLDTDSIAPALHTTGQKILNKTLRRARKNTSETVVEKITQRGADGRRQIIERPPLMTHVALQEERSVLELFDEYRASVAPDISLLLSQFRVDDLARRVVGVGSVGTRCVILVLSGPQQESLVLQIKEANRSVVQQFGGVSDQPAGSLAQLAGHRSEGQRVVANQRILQAVSDPFLGFFNSNGRDYYVRQFRDMKGSIELESLTPRAFQTYSNGCASVLARAHAQSPHAAMIAGYLGGSPRFSHAVSDFAFAYAERSAQDFEALRASLAAGM